MSPITSGKEGGFAFNEPDKINAERIGESHELRRGDFNAAIFERLEVASLEFDAPTQCRYRETEFFAALRNRGAQSFADPQGAVRDQCL